MPPLWATLSNAARSTARMIRMCVPHRQRLPFSDARICSRVGRLLCAIKAAVDGVLTNSGLPASALQNPGTTCPATSDGNSQFNAPYADDAYTAGAPDQPLLYICYADTPGLDLTAAPTDNSYKGADVNVIVVMSYGFATGFMSGALGNSVHVAVNTHMVIGGF